MWRQDIRASLAHARMLAGQDIISAADLQGIEQGMKSISAEIEAGSFNWNLDDEDVHLNIEKRLTALVGEAGKRLHTGRSRNDQVATDLKLWLKARVPELQASARTLLGALVELAEEYADQPLPGYTHLQRAQPVTAGHHALAYVEMLARDLGRLADAMRRLDTSPLGCGALAGSAWPIDRETLASELGFEGGAARNSLDAVSDRDHVLELAFAASLVMLHLSRLAEDWIFFASQEAGFLALGDAVTTGSSLMPQKKNPDALELIRGKAGRVVGHLTGLCMTLKGLPLAYDKDLQEDKEALFDALDTTDACLRVATLCVRNARYRREVCTAACESGYLDATDLADLLVGAGLAFRDAHERVGAAVREAIERGCELRELPLERQRQLFPELAGSDLTEQLAVQAVLARRGALGGTAPARVRAEVQAWKQRLESC